MFEYAKTSFFNPYSAAIKIIYAINFFVIIKK